MVIVTDYIRKLKNGDTKRGYYMDGNLKKILDQVFEGVMRHKNNCVFIFDGDLGTGKSFSAVKVAHYWRFLQGKDFSVAHIVFSLEQFLELLPNLKAGDVVVFDEAGLIAMSRDALQKANKKLMKILMTMRSRQVFFVFCLPSFYDMDKTLAIHRADALIHMKGGKFGQKGEFSFYDKPQLKKLFLLGKKYYSYPLKSRFFGKFAKAFPLREGVRAYEDKKQTSVESFAKSDSSTEGYKWKVARDNLVKHLKDEKGMSYDEIAVAVGNLTGNAVGKIYRRVKKEEEDSQKSALENGTSS